ncbi:membrane protein insertase YidC [Gallaecimonas xiamenensis]|uniref:Membrane protein insertase YidC n=1 Tax=Gallaecimonas xiamenensis 3-C-1 TaxID=745411 RepID=K2KF35_9GAMM|nr:membrane protein insertase YidC [Gallaecimonas xiamenensis]EKE75985.1 60 kDa inner membrane protein [Gallaecimonas xiamenensis 3-C-1]
MESQRSLLFFGLLAVSFLLFSAWQEDQAPKPAPAAVTETVPAAGTDYLPKSDAADVVQSAAAPSESRIIHFGNDVLSLAVDTRGGDIVDAQLDKFAATQGSEERFELLTRTSDFAYLAMSGTVGNDGADTRGRARPIYNAAEPVTLADGSQQLVLSYQDAKGVTFKKTMTLAPGKYVVNTLVEVQNGSTQPLVLEPFVQILRSNHEPDGGAFMAHSYTGAVYSTEEKKYEKYSFDDFKKRDLKLATDNGWVAMLQHYFVTAWAPKSNTDMLFYTQQAGDKAIIGAKTLPVTIAPQGSTSLSADLYVGPKDQDAMAAVAPRLEKTVDYGILWFIGELLFWLLKHLHALVTNWGFAIILLTLIVRGAMYPLTKAQYTSMAKMRALQPKLTALKERYGDDRQRMSQAMMELYKKEKVNPLGGCFPLLLQMPIFIALYWVLQESVELRHAPFMLWITDLSAKDPFFVLPVLFVLSMWVTQKLQPSTIADPMQQKVMQLMPVMMGAFFAFFPSGLVLYWLVSNLVSITQQLIIYKGLEKKGLK